jgi:hypothetical protein
MIYEKKVKCPVCNKEFMTTKVKTSKLKLVKRDEDFLNYYKGEEHPLKYEVFLCPFCGYAAMEKRFDKIKPSGKSIILRNVTPKWHKRDLKPERSFEDAVNIYKLALYCGEIIKKSKVELGNICLRIGWLYRIQGIDNEEKRFLRYGRDLFEESYYKENLRENGYDEVTLSYLIGELSRRLGENEKALNWFNTVFTVCRNNKNPVIEEMARDQWNLIREGRTQKANTTDNE